MTVSKSLIHCPRCGLWKVPSEFGRNVTRPNDKNDYCKPCHRLNSAETRARIRARNLAARNANN